MITNHDQRLHELINTVAAAAMLAANEENALRNEDKIEEAEAFKLKKDILRAIAQNLGEYQKDKAGCGSR